MVTFDCLPAAVLKAVLLQLKGDVRSLSAAACVSRALASAAKDPQVWEVQDLRRLDLRRLKQGVTGERLRQLVARAGRGLHTLQLPLSSSLTDADLLEALQQPHQLTTFSAGSSDSLSARGVCGALASRRGLMRYVDVGGLRAVSWAEDYNYADELFEEELFEEIDYGRAALFLEVMHGLRGLLAPGGTLAGATQCEGEADDGPCYFLCGHLQQCNSCDKALCSECSGAIFEDCLLCKLPFCRESYCGACQPCVTYSDFAEMNGIAGFYDDYDADFS